MHDARTIPAQYYSSLSHVTNGSSIVYCRRRLGPRQRLGISRTAVQQAWVSADVALNFRAVRILEDSSTMTIPHAPAHIYARMMHGCKALKKCNNCLGPAYVSVCRLGLLSSVSRVQKPTPISESSRNDVRITRAFGSDSLPPIHAHARLYFDRDLPYI